jgi:hypothetical protein
MTTEHSEMIVSFQVAQLVTKYNMSWDEGRFADVSSCFTEGGVFVDASGEAHEGRAAIETFGKKSRELFGSMRHVTANHLVCESANGWTHRCYMVFVSGLGQPDSSTVTGRYDDEFILGPDGPLFTLRRVYLDS